jgi:hypothetical protein
MIEIFIKVIITLGLLYGTSILLFSGILVKPFLPLIEQEDVEDPPVTTRELIGMGITLLTTVGISGMLIAITWVF